MDLNFLERQIARFRPGWAARRLSDRLVLEQVRGMAAEYQGRGYDAGRRDRRTQGWQATGAGPNAQMQGALATVIKRSRDLCRNNEWARNAKRKWVAQAVSTGLVPRPDTTAKRAKSAAMTAWNAFVEQCDPEGLGDFYAKQAMVMAEVFEAGACFVRWYLRPPSWGLTVPLQCEVLSHEFLDTRRFQANGQNQVINGIEFDPDGRRVAYYLFRQHPGEIVPMLRSTVISDRVPASEVDHVFFPELAGQITGMPWLSATMLRLRDMADRDEAALLREKIAACLAVFVRRQGGATRALAQAADQSKDSKGRATEKLQPGMISYVESDGDITVANPPNVGDADFTNRNLYAVAAGVGLTHSALSGNLSNVNFTSLREGKLDFWPILDQVQWFMLVPMLCRPAWRRVMAAAAGRGMQVSPTLGAKWATPKRPWVNPVDDAKGEAAELAMGLESWADKVTARGHDPDELLEEIQQWLPKLAEAGLNPSSAAGIAGDKGRQDPAGSPASQDPKAGAPASKQE